MLRIRDLILPETHDVSELLKLISAAKVVLPADGSISVHVTFSLIDEEKELCTLVTCTPYGINSHRLLVRGHRVTAPENLKRIRVAADATRIEPILIAPLLAVPLLLLLLIGLLVSGRKRKQK